MIHKNLLNISTVVSNSFITLWDSSHSSQEWYGSRWEFPHWYTPLDGIYLPREGESLRGTEYLWTVCLLTSLFTVEREENESVTDRHGGLPILVDIRFPVSPDDYLKYIRSKTPVLSYVFHYLTETSPFIWYKSCPGKIQEALSWSWGLLWVR